MPNEGEKLARYWISVAFHIRRALSGFQYVAKAKESYLREKNIKK